MPIKSYWKSVVRVCKKFEKAVLKHKFSILVGLGIVVLVCTAWTLFAPQTITYKFDRAHNCQVSPRLFPSASRIKASSTFAVSRTPSLSIGSLPIYSYRLCATAIAAPQAQKTYSQSERLFNWPVLGHTLHVTTKPYPVLAHALTQRQTLPPTAMLLITLNQADTTFSYAVKANDHSAQCISAKAVLACKLDTLQLSYAQKYDLSIVRQFNKKTLSTIATAPIKTLTPLTITKTSIAMNAVAQDKPTELSIETDKPLTGMGDASLVAIKPDKSETVIPTTATFSGTTLKVTFGAELPRKTAFELRLTSLTANDGSGLATKSLKLPFATSGGPKVVSTNIGVRSVAQNPSISINFDQALLASQSPAPLVTFSVLGQAQPATVSISGSSIIVKPQNTIPLCATFTIKVAATVQNQYGISGDSAWSINSRAICYTTFSIGTSVNGRAITAYRFGSGPNPIIYMGAMHGNEVNSKTLMTEWFNELNANPQRLTSQSLVIIPSVDPDGVASNSRLNAHGVDLNRNFPASDWKSLVTSPDNPNPTPVGGPNPLSEPESQAIAAFIQQEQPRLTMSFHSAAAVVEANEAGDSVSIAASYASIARYQAVPKSQSAPIFQYDTTGAMEDWMRTSLGRPAIVVELLSHTSSEFARNREALWYTVSL